MGRNVVQNGRAIEQLGFAISIGFRGRQLFGAVGQILRQRQQGVKQLIIRAGSLLKTAADQRQNRRDILQPLPSLRGR